MKKLISSLFLLFILGATQSVEAKGVIVYHNGPTTSKVADLPEDVVIEGKHVNLNVMYEQFGLFWLPIWNYGDVKYVLMDDEETTYWDLDEEELQAINSQYDLDLSGEPSIPFWTKVGLKPVILGLGLFLIWGQIGGKKKEDEIGEETEKEADEEA